MIGAMERIIEATERGDAAEARAAAAAFAELGDDAATADRALRIAMSEGGAAVAAPALARLAAVMSSLDETRARIGTAAESARGARRTSSSVGDWPTATGSTRSSRVAAWRASSVRATSDSTATWP
jgi:hypothetical protein